MKINNDTRFPYPVLSEETGDYAMGSFSIEVLIEEAPKNGKLKIGYTVFLSESKLEQIVNGGSATVGLFITCLETFYNQLTPINASKGNLEFSPGILKGRVSLRPFIWASRKIEDYSNSNLHTEYGDSSLNFDIGSVLAIGNELIINVGHEKLAPMESIFSLAVSNQVREGEIKVQLDSPTIIIHSNAETYQMINALRGTRPGQSVLLNSIYLPAVMEVLSTLKDGESNLADKKWFKVFNAKCEHLNINLKKGNILEDAQKLLKSPINKIKSIGELI